VQRECEVEDGDLGNYILKKNRKNFKGENGTFDSLQTAEILNPASERQEIGTHSKYISQE